MALYRGVDQDQVLSGKASGVRRKLDLSSELLRVVLGTLLAVMSSGTIWSAANIEISYRTGPQRKLRTQLR